MHSPLCHRHSTCSSVAFGAHKIEYTGLSIDDIGRVVSERLAEHDKMKETRTLNMSKASGGAVSKLLVSLEIIVKDEAVPEGLSNIPIDGYNWNGKHEDDSFAFAGAFEFLKSLLGPANFGPGCYQLVDVHSSNALLNFDDEKVGKLRGGTDIVITPFALSKMSYALELCVLFEIKTSDRVRTENGFSPSEPQALLELVAARCMSHQPNVLVILTDLTTGAMGFTFEYVAARKSFTVCRYESLSLSQMSGLVTSFLANNCVPCVDFIPRAESNDPRQLQPIEFKRRRLSAPQLPVEWEHFMDIMEDRDATDIERRMITRQLFRSFESFQEPSRDSSWLSMYS